MLPCVQILERYVWENFLNNISIIKKFLGGGFFACFTQLLTYAYSFTSRYAVPPKWCYQQKLKWKIYGEFIKTNSHYLLRFTKSQPGACIYLVRSFIPTVLCNYIIMHVSSKIASMNMVNGYFLQKFIYSTWKSVLLTVACSWFRFHRFGIKKWN